MMTKNQKFIELGTFVTMFLKEHQEQIDEDFIGQMADLAVDYHIYQDDDVPVVFPSVRIEEWKHNGVVVVEKTANELFEMHEEVQPCELILGRLYGLKGPYLEKFSEAITETLMEVYTHGDTDHEEAED
jgi:hypothetical protein